MHADFIARPLAATNTPRIARGNGTTVWRAVPCLVATVADVASQVSKTLNADQKQMHADEAGRLRLRGLSRPPSVSPGKLHGGCRPIRVHLRHLLLICV